MIGYVTLGTNDFDKAAGFYDALFATIGVERYMDFDTFIAWAASPSTPAVCIIHPHNGEPATVGNGCMTALLMDSTDKVDAMHAKALELGGANEGDAGPRDMAGFYAGYFRDLDGNKLCVFTMTSEAAN